MRTPDLKRKKRSKQLLWGGLSLITGFPFLAAAVSATLLNGRLSRGLPVSAGLIFLAWYISGFQAAAITAVCAATVAISVRSGFPLLKTVYLCSGLSLLTGALLSLGFPGFMNIGETELEPLRDIYVSAGMESTTIDGVFSLISYYSPGIGAIQIVFGSIVSVLFFRSLTGNAMHSSIRESAGFRMHWGFAWLPIICLIVLVYAHGNTFSSTALRTARNLLVFCFLPYGLEGIQVAVKWAKGKTGLIFMLIMSAFFAPPLILGGVVLLGILDTWFDYRKKIDKKIERMKNEGSSDQGS